METPLGPKRGRGETRADVERLDNEGRSPREIATALEISTQAVYAHLRRIHAEPAEGRAAS